MKAAKKKRLTICFDMDHTLAHSAWRDEHIAPAMESGEWDTYHSMSNKDKPAVPMIALAAALMAAGHNVFIVTARPRRWLRITRNQLIRAGLDIDISQILMRPEEEFRPSPEVKLELTSHLDIDLFIDDREDVVTAFAEAGITTLQVRLTS
jgi:phosphoglycolate phosphatase-like HAD superfamily hydrolase